MAKVFYLRPMISQSMERTIRWALEEDLGAGDCTSESSLPDDLMQEGWIIAKESGIVAGLEVALTRKPEPVKAQPKSKQTKKQENILRVNKSVRH